MARAGRLWSCILILKFKLFVSAPNKMLHFRYVKLNIKKCIHNRRKLCTKTFYDGIGNNCVIQM